MNDGILLVDKPEGMSSFGVVARVRRKLSEAAGFVEIKGKDGVVRQKRKKVKVGHTGTLDPFATGLLILLVGKETKRAGEFLKLNKEYIATMRLGMVSTTGDPEGELSPFKVLAQSWATISSSERLSRPPAVAGAAQPALSVVTCESSLDERLPKIAADNVDVVSLSEIEKTIGGFVGEIEQMVPAFSAVKINGQRAYKLARAGKEVEMPRRKVRIDEIEILRYEWPELKIRCKVSSGTYIRTLAEDIGKALGVGAYLTALRRTQVGKYRVEDARTLAEIMGEDDE